MYTATAPKGQEESLFNIHDGTSSIEIQQQNPPEAQEEYRCIRFVMNAEGKNYGFTINQ